jgi:hypothetical protein
MGKYCCVTQELRLTSARIPTIPPQKHADESPLYGGGSPTLPTPLTFGAPRVYMLARSSNRQADS